MRTSAPVESTGRQTAGFPPTPRPHGHCHGLGHGPRTCGRGRRGSLAIAAVAALALALAPGVVGAQNIIPNGRFDSGIAGYTSTNPGKVMHDPDLDLGSARTPGSLVIVNDTSSSNTIVSARTCLTQPITPGPYHFEYWVRFKPGESANGVGRVQFTTYPTANCSGSPAGSFNGPNLGPALGRGLWLRARGGDITNAGGTIPAGTNSVQVYVALLRTTAGVLSAHFDGLFLAPVGKPLCKGRVPTIGGTDLDDSIFGTDGPDVIVAFGGDDTIDARGGGDVVCAGKGNDTVSGGGGDDIVLGQGGNDDLFGDEGDDVLKGGPGKDTLGGGPDFDVCVGGGGKDSAFSSCEKFRSVP